MLTVGHQRGNHSHSCHRLEDNLGIFDRYPRITSTNVQEQFLTSSSLTLRQAVLIREVSGKKTVIANKINRISASVVTAASVLYTSICAPIESSFYIQSHSDNLFGMAFTANPFMAVQEEGSAHCSVHGCCSFLSFP